MNGRKRTRQRTPNRATSEFDWFCENRAELFAKYPWQHLVIRDRRVVNASPSFTSALTYALSHYELGEFIIHKCTPDDSYDTVPVLTRMSSNPEFDNKEYAFTYKFSEITRLIITPVRITTPSENLHFDTLAIWDTGAAHSMIGRQVVEALALEPIGKKKVSSATDIQKVNKYRVNVFIEQLPYFELEVLECGPLFDPEIGVLIGMDVISHGDFAITNHDGHTVFTFCVPSVGALNFCEE